MNLRKDHYWLRSVANLSLGYALNKTQQKLHILSKSAASRRGSSSAYVGSVGGGEG